MHTCLPATALPCSDIPLSIIKLYMMVEVRGLELAHWGDLSVGMLFVLTCFLTILTLFSGSGWVKWSV